MTKIKDVSIIFLIAFISLLFMHQTVFAEAEKTTTQLCDQVIYPDGSINRYQTEARNELKKRSKTLDDCRAIRKLESDMIQVEKEELAQEMKKQKIDSMKADCRDLGFTDGTEGMGNCVLKLMELAKPNQVVISNPSSGSNSSSTDAEMLRIEKERLAMEKYKSRQDAAEKLMDIGNCWSVMGDFSPWC